MMPVSSRILSRSELPDKNEVIHSHTGAVHVKMCGYGRGASVS